jgi:mannose-6-phosphate isomerase-like protein (cupin superfamily)
MNNREIISKSRASVLRKNKSNLRKLKISQKEGLNFYAINGNDLMKFKESDVSHHILVVKPNNFYMIFNMSDSDLVINYSHDPSLDELIYDPYKYEHSNKVDITAEEIKKYYEVPNGYVETLPKWYSFKFTYKEYNLIFIKANMGITWQQHEKRNEFWEILGGNPIIIVNNKVHFFVKNHEKFEMPMGTIHSVINPNNDLDKWVIIKESWNGSFDEMDIKRIFNPNHYF